MNLVRIGMISMVLATLVACSATAPRAPQEYDPTNSARIRVFGQNAIRVRLYPGKTCTPWYDDRVIKASGTISQSMKSFFGSAENTSIGMPVTERIRNLKDQRFAQEFYNEYVLNASEPVVISMGFDGSTPQTWRYCTPPDALFSPEPGNDYEASFIMGGSSCYISLSKIQKDTGATTPMTTVKKAERCPAQQEPVQGNVNS